MLLAPLAAVAVIAQEPARKPSLTGTIEKIASIESKVLGRSRDILVYLPPDYARQYQRRYPVIYLHDGQNVFDGATSFIPNQEWRADETAQGMIEAGMIEPVIMVAIPNAGMDRANEYLPTRFKFGDSMIGGRADDYGKMITDELKPLIDKRFRTKRDPANTALIGSSFGGIVTLHLGLTRPEVFGKLGVVSPSIWVDGRVMLERIAELKKKPSLKIWTDMGGSEGPEALADARAFRDALLKKGWMPGKDLMYFEEPRAEHNEAAWARRFPLILNYLFGKKA